MRQSKRWVLMVPSFAQELESHEHAEEFRRGEIIKLRFRNIYLRNALNEKEAEVKQGINYEEMEQMLLQNQLLQG